MNSTVPSSGLLENLKGDDASTKKLLYGIAVPTLISLVLIGFILNGYVLLAYRWLRRPISANLTLSLSLAGADAWLALLTSVELITNSFLPLHFGGDAVPRCLRMTVYCLIYPAMQTSILHLLALAINHCVGTLCPLRHIRLVTSTRLRVVIGFIWILPLLSFAIFNTLVFPDQLYRSPDCSEIGVTRTFAYRLGATLLIFIALAATVGLYARILCHMSRQQKEKDDEKAGISRESRRHAPQRSKRQSWNLFITMLLLMGSFILLILPSALLYLISCSTCPLPGKTIVATLGVQGFILLMSGLKILLILKIIANPLIYAARISELRYALRRMHGNSRLGQALYAAVRKTTSQMHGSKKGSTLVQAGREKMHYLRPDYPEDTSRSKSLSDFDHSSQV